jgi:hypothetical protein
MDNRLILLTGIVIAGLTACGDPEYRPADEAMPIEDSVFGDAVQMLEKAKGVEDELERMAREREEQMRRQGG